MKRFRNKLLLFLMAVYFCLFVVSSAVSYVQSLLVGALIANESTTSEATGNINLPEAVLRWEKKVREECEKNEIPFAVNYILAIIMCESGGNAEQTPDIMQCSESKGWAPNTIQDPNQSIEIGVAYFASGYHGHPETEIWNVVQGYAYGMGYLSYTGKTYSFDDAIAFAKKQSGGRKATYTNPIALAKGYSWRYAYSNMFYKFLVEQYIGTNTGGGGNTEMTKIALGEIGNAGGEKFWRWYGFNFRVEWCGVFVSWCAAQAKLDMPKFSYCPTGISQFQARNQWTTTYPKEGYVIFFDWDGDGVSDHVGLVTKCEKGTVYTVEGNSGNRVAERQYLVTAQQIMGYGTP